MLREARERERERRTRVSYFLQGAHPILIIFPIVTLERDSRADAVEAVSLSLSPSHGRREEAVFSLEAKTN